MTKLNKQQRKANEARKAYVSKQANIDWRQAPGPGVNNSAFGRLVEVALTPTTSSKTTLAKAGKPDNFVRWISANGRKTTRPVEIKTNGGRINTELLNGSRDKLIVYTMDVCNSTTKGVRRIVPPVLMTVGYFMDLLESFGAIKTVNKNKQFDGYAIQVSNKRLYEHLLNYPLTFDPERYYTQEDFEVLGL